MSLSPKSKMRIRTAVRDYQEMFPGEYKLLLLDVEYAKQNLKTEYAEMPDQRGGAYRRLLFVIDERLSAMIGMKLTHEELVEFKESENTRWFASEFPQFAVSKAV